MRTALAIATRALGCAAPNPAVGCVIVKDGVVVGRGWTQPGGRPHAETEALRRAGGLARGATVYVSLEPCCHHGLTPPCAEALIEAGVRRVVAAAIDPDPRVSGRGLARLAAAGIAAECGLLGAAAEEINLGFVLRLTAGRPMVTLKLATTLDGRIATHRGESRWITSGLARDRAQLLRARHDAVMVGVGTAIADAPQLTCRLPGLESRSPARVILDGRARLPLTSPLVASARTTPTLLVVMPGIDSHRIRAYVGLGVDVIEVGPDADGRPSVNEVMRALAGRGMTRVLVEGGSHVAAALLRASVVDRLIWFRAASVMGGDGVPAAAPFGVDTIKGLSRFTRRTVLELGADIMETYVPETYVPARPPGSEG
jgi:diaminohydroxyphosphoribosylaminopyrimidine deaminase/5-amino-6-(5-phosphoribosylamino)uracil reductase